MTRKFIKFIATAIFGFMLVSAAIFGAVYGLMQRDAPANMARAEQVVQTLSQRWQFSDIAAEFTASVISAVDADDVQRSFDPFRRLGRLVGVRDMAMGDYQVNFSDEDGLHRRATLTLTGDFEHGEARITLIIVTSGGVSKVQHFNIKPVRMPPVQTRRGFA